MFCRHQDLFELPASDGGTYLAVKDSAMKESKKKKVRRVIISSSSEDDDVGVPGTSCDLKRVESGFGRLQ